MQKISTFLSTSNECSLYVPTSFIRQDTSEGLRFAYLDFDVSLMSQNDDALIIDKNEIHEIIILSHDGKKEIRKIQIKKIKRIAFDNCRIQYLPLITAPQVWRIEFDHCIINDGYNMIKNILTKTNQNKKVYFTECKVENLHFGDVRDIQYNSNVELCYFEFFGGTIEDLTIENIELASKFYINKQYHSNDQTTRITNLRISNSIFKENFKLHNCEVHNSRIEDTDFEKHADFFKSIFTKGMNHNETNYEIYFKALNFKGLALFGDCGFKNKLIFQYITFEGFSHFRRAYFKKGLDLDYTNIQKEMNFFDVSGLEHVSSKEKTSQETYRIIKHNFQKLGNVIEANKYHALELEANRDKIWSTDKFSFELLSDGLISCFNWVSSNYSRYWILPLFWIFLVGLITAQQLGCNNLWVDTIRYSTITQYDFINSHPVLFLFNKAALGFLYYQFIIAIRKNTRK